MPDPGQLLWLLVPDLEGVAQLDPQGLKEPSQTRRLLSPPGLCQGGAIRVRAPAGRDSVSRQASFLVLRGGNPALRLALELQSYHQPIVHMGILGPQAAASRAKGRG